MHGLTGGSWKRSHDQPRSRKRTTSRETVWSQRFRDLPLTRATAPVPDPPPHVVRELLPAPGQSGGDSQAWWERGADARHTDDRGSGRADGGQDVLGAESRTGLSPGLLRLSAGQVRIG